MKRSIGSLFVCLAFLCGALSASATNYSGSGVWQKTDGTSGTYTVTAEISTDDDGNLEIDQVIDLGNQTHEIDFVIQKVDDFSFNILDDDGDAIGTGYCFPGDADGVKLCHSDSYADGYLIESTVKISPSAIYRMGSKIDAITGERTAWKDSLTPASQN